MADQAQQLLEAIVEILDTHAEIVAITERDSENVVAWGNIGEPTDAARQAGLIAFELIVGPDDVAADAGAVQAQIQFAATARDQETANELIGVVRRVIDAPAFLALDPPIDAYRTRRARRPMPYDADEQLARSDTDITLRVYFPIGE